MKSTAAQRRTQPEQHSTLVVSLILENTKLEVTAVALYEKVKEIVVRELSVPENQVTENATFQGDLNADSLDVVELVMAFEDEFDVEIPDEEAEKITTVKEAVDYLEKKMNG